MPVPPNRPLRFGIVGYYLIRSYPSRGGATAAGAEALHAVAPRSVEENCVKISTGQKIIFHRFLQKSTIAAARETRSIETEGGLRVAVRMTE